MSSKFINTNNKTYKYVYFPIKDCREEIKTWINNNYKIVLSSSTCYEILKLNMYKSNNPKQLNFNKIVYWGYYMEIILLRELKKQFKFNIINSNQRVIHYKFNNIQASADGIIKNIFKQNTFTILEIKCPTNGRIPYRPYIKDYLQVLIELECYQLNNAILFYWSPSGFNMFHIIKPTIEHWNNNILLLLLYHTYNKKQLINLLKSKDLTNIQKNNLFKIILNKNLQTKDYLRQQIANSSINNNLIKTICYQYTKSEYTVINNIQWIYNVNKTFGFNRINKFKVNY